MKKYFIDFTGAKYLGQLHLIIKEQLEFPDWYGENLSALWDLLMGHIEPGIIYIKGLDDLPKSISNSSQDILKIFLRAQEKGKHNIILSEFEEDE